MDNKTPQSDGSREQTGISLISEERFRQVSEEGWSAQHDDSHTDGALAKAAACYAAGTNELREPQRRSQNSLVTSYHDVTWWNLWAWGDEWWKPTPNNRIRELVKAGALIAAEIDRLLRASPLSSDGSPNKKEEVPNGKQEAATVTSVQAGEASGSGVEDTKRLDWLCSRAAMKGADYPEVELIIPGPPFPSSELQTRCRDAIDTAMKQSNKGETK